jgi:hypothetical protein
VNSIDDTGGSGGANLIKVALDYLWMQKGMKIGNGYIHETFLFTG